MKTFIYSLKIILIGILSIIFGMYVIIQSIFLVIGPDYKEGTYTMTYKVYYPGNPKTYTITNNWPMGLTSHRGTNAVIKETESPIIKKAFNGVHVFETSAPIEVVSYTYKEKE